MMKASTMQTIIENALSHPLKTVYINIFFKCLPNDNSWTLLGYRFALWLEWFSYVDTPYVPIYVGQKLILHLLMYIISYHLFY